MSLQVLRIAKGSLRWQQRKRKRVMVLNLFLFLSYGPCRATSQQVGRIYWFDSVYNHSPLAPLRSSLL